MIDVRTARPADAEAIAAVILPIQQIEFGIAISLEAQPDLHDVQAFHQHGKGNFWVAETEGKVVGTIALLDIGSNEAALRKMFVAAAFRGRELGVASSLLQRCSRGPSIEGSRGSIWEPPRSSWLRTGSTRGTVSPRSRARTCPRPSP